MIAKKELINRIDRLERKSEEEEKKQGSRNWGGPRRPLLFNLGGLVPLRTWLVDFHNYLLKLTTNWIKFKHITIFVSNLTKLEHKNKM